jgi:hypothetical protein
MSAGDRFRAISRNLGALGWGVAAQFAPGAKQALQVAAEHEQFLHWVRCLGVDEDRALETLEVMKTLVAENNLHTPGYLGPLVPYEMARRDLLRELMAPLPDPGRFVCGNDGIRVVRGYDGDWLHARRLEDPPECDSPDPISVPRPTDKERS